MYLNEAIDQYVSDRRSKGIPGEWVSEKPGKSTFRKSSSTDVRLALARGSQRPESGAS